ncbi:MAG: site-specific integrase [Holophagales bacterium]|nr:site-specific integrase [Holophagales bacterium]MYC08688.1 site-specific integrase [Holophagales bacterium]
MDTDSSKDGGSHQTVSVRDALRTALAENTRRAYRGGWRKFAAYCGREQLDPLVATPEHVAEFLVSVTCVQSSRGATTQREKPLALGTLRICLAAINRWYGERGLPSPARSPKVASVLRGLGRLANARPRQVKALREHEIGAIVAHCDRLAARRECRAMAVRDAAVIAVGFAGALRRSEICGLRLEDVEFLDRSTDDGGMFLHVRRSKTDQLGEGQTIAVPEGAFIRPVDRLRRWLDLSGATTGPLFQTLWRGGHLRGRPLHPTDIARLVKRHVSAIGLDPTDYSGHSLRSGFVTSAAIHSARLDKIMEVTRHASAAMVIRYIRQANAFEDHAGAAFL